MLVLEPRYAGRGLVGQLTIDRHRGPFAAGRFVPCVPVARDRLATMGLGRLEQTTRPRELSVAERAAANRLANDRPRRLRSRLRGTGRDLRRPFELVKERQLHELLAGDRRALLRLGLATSSADGLISERGDGYGGRTDLRDSRTVVELKLGADLPALHQLLRYRERLTIGIDVPAAHLVCGRVGDYRIISTIEDDELLILVATNGHRHDVYGR